MPVTVVVGGQYGSEGKGKVAHRLVRDSGAKATAVRVGGSNSGHTISGDDGKPRVLRQLPTAAWLPGPDLVLPPGSYLEPELLLREIAETGVGPGRLRIDPDAAVIGPDDVRRERGSGLNARIGSTESGTGSAVQRRVARDGTLRRAGDVPALRPFLCDTLKFLRGRLDDGGRVVIEGTQGYGLSNLHGGHRDHATSRDTTAAGFVAETGLSPLDVDEVVVVVRAFPIRVAGASGPLPLETTWQAVAERAGRPGLAERTTVTGKIRRVAEFDPAVVVRAIAANRPTLVVMNHVDYAVPDHDRRPDAVLAFVEQIEFSLGRQVDVVGLGPASLVATREFRAASAAAARGRAVSG